MHYIAQSADEAARNRKINKVALKVLLFALVLILCALIPVLFIPAGVVALFLVARGVARAANRHSGI